MSGLLSILSNSANSLLNNQAWTATVSNNIANANTPGYSRQTVGFATASPAERFGNNYIGAGAVIAGITQSRDRFIEAQLPTALGASAFSSTQTSVLQSLSSFDTGKGVAPALSNFFTKLRNLSQDPGSLSYRQAAVGSAQTLAMAFNSTAKELQSARTAVDQSLEGALPEVNQTAAQIASLNAQIRVAAAGGASPNDLLDARQKLADRFATLTGATPVPDSTGDLNLSLPDGTSLVNGAHAAVLSTSPDATNRGHDRLMVTQPDGSGPVAVNGAPGGTLGGLLAARDGALKDAETSNDQLAFDLSGAINAVHQTGYALDGSTGRDLFTTSAAPLGAALGLSVNAAITANVSLLGASASAATVPGDATNLQAMINTESTALSTGADASSTLAGLTAAYGSAASKAQATSAGDAAVLTQVTSMRDSVSGVSIDEELVTMQKAQRAYQAVAKVISTTSSLLDTLMAIK